MTTNPRRDRNLEDGMIMEPSERSIVVHRAPIWRDRADYIFRAAIPDPAPTASIEQLWGRKQGHLIEVCCIPYFLYDVNLGDLVSLSDENTLESVVEDKGHCTFRAFFSEHLESIADVDRDLRGRGAGTEWLSNRLVALDAPSGEAASELSAFLATLENRGVLEYETGRLRSP
ncbi:DUF4265 domain-containing protein [Herbiconiux sp. VKM Ac-1786]|uniref:DUF4265 domain-containing protein n=1 Tax=Herbiconiux sp. VKM Ac-1786 TaxID=2783824 RepID=UPI00188A085F|nr:DUF4265 domain-containing protein [Herbiconiux sp. VKM Ac-1786]MBF4573159.1 DUF4265 domain-containing protein [Herbiconiux sp. VKM Ac-1786]